MKTLFRCAIITLTLSLAGCYAPGFEPMPLGPSTPSAPMPMPAPMPAPQPRELPPGNYQDTCQNCHINGHRLHCDCQNRNQMLISTALSNAWACRDIQNRDGRLSCTSRSHYHPYRPRPHKEHRLPAGNYRQSCDSCSMRYGELSCVCKDRNNNPVRTDLSNPRQCGRIENDNGNLVCR